MRRLGGRKPTRHPKRRLILIALGVVLAVLIVAGVALDQNRTPAKDISWGVTFSSNAARELGTDPHQSYLSILNELKPKRLRLIAYWTTIEAKSGSYDFSDLDFQVAEAERRHIPYIIAVGQRVPRYPECFAPDWAKQLPLTQEHTRQLAFMTAVVQHYKSRTNLTGWQVENEPYVHFGICPKLDQDFLSEEVALVRSLDSKQIIMTDSGELSLWLQVTRFPDTFGSTLYRTVISNYTGGVFYHFWPPWFYTIRGNLAKLVHPNLHRLIIAELQGEPWANRPLNQLTQAEYQPTMSHQQFETNRRFTEAVGFPEVYWWGAEWWYYEKLHGDSYFWDSAKALFAGSK